MSKDIPVKEVVKNPIEIATRNLSGKNFLKQVPRPNKIFSDRENSQGFDFGDLILFCVKLFEDHKDIKESSFDLVFDTVGLEVSRQQAISVVKPGGIIVHIGLTQPAGSFNFRKATLQEVTFIGTYCYTNKEFGETIDILTNKKTRQDRVD